MNIQNKKQYEFIVGIDLGHGETSAAICPLQWESQDQQLEAVKDLEMGGNSKVIPSAITILENGTAYIGASAFSTEVLKKAKVNVCFKKAPVDVNGEQEKLMTRYMKEVYTRIRENNTAILQDGNHLVYIATPSGWNKQQQDLYVKMAENAGIPIAGVTKESRAAFVRAQQDATSGLGKNIHKGAIVFDMGSSTLDCTYMNDNNPNLIDFGYDCGASHVEKIIYSQKREECECIRVFEERYPDLVDYLLFEARLAKEKIYFDPSLKYKKTINFEDFVDDEDLEDEKFKFIFEPGKLNELLETSGYIKQIEDAMIDFIQTKINGQKIYGVFLTGGASRMDFIKDLVCRHWGVTMEQIHRDTDPSLTISQGVAEVARIDLRSEGADKDIATAIETIERDNNIFDDFANLYADYITQRVEETVSEALADFSSSSNDRSVSDLQRTLKSNIQVAVSSPTDAADYLQNAIDTETADVRRKVDEVVQLYSRQGAEVAIPQIKVADISVGNVSIDGIIRQVTDQIAANTTSWLEVGGIGAAAFLGAFLLGPLAGIAAAFLAGSFGKSEEEKKREALTKKLDIETRCKVHNEFANQWNQENMSNTIRQQTYNTMAGNGQLKSDINRALRTLLESYKEELKKARILVD